MKQKKNAPVRLGVVFPHNVAGGNDGCAGNFRYFHCRPGHGVLVAQSKVHFATAPHKEKVFVPLEASWKLDDDFSASVKGGDLLFHSPGNLWGSDGWGTEAVLQYKRCAARQPCRRRAAQRLPQQRRALPAECRPSIEARGSTFVERTPLNPNACGCLLCPMRYRCAETEKAAAGCADRGALRLLPLCMLGQRC